MTLKERGRRRVDGIGDVKEVRVGVDPTLAPRLVSAFPTRGSGGVCEKK